MTGRRSSAAANPPSGFGDPPDPRVWLVNLSGRDLSEAESAALRAESLGAESTLPLVHLGLLSMAEFVKAGGVEVAICDGADEQLSDAAVAARLQRSRPVLVGITCAQVTMRRVLRLVREMKTWSPPPFVVLGGHQAAFTAADILRDIREVDAVVVGEGELPFFELARRLLAAPDSGLHGIPGVCLRQGGKADAAPAALHGLEVVRDLDRLSWPGEVQARQGKRHVALITSRGCFGRCSFCSTPNFNLFSQGSRWRSRSPESVVDEIGRLVADFRVESIHIHDPDFVGLTPAGFERARAIAGGLAARKIRAPIRFSCQASAAVRVGLDFWRLWKEAGLEKVFIGFESGIEEELRRYHKPSRVRDGVEAHQLLSRAGVRIQAGFIMFNPQSTADSVRENLAFLRAIDQAPYFRHVCLPLSAYPGTSSFDDLDRQGLLSYEKRYLEVTPRYEDPLIGELAALLEAEPWHQRLADSVVLDFDFALAGDRRGFKTGIGWIEKSPAVERTYRAFRRRRGRTIQSGMQRLLGSGSSAMAAELRELRRHLETEFDHFQNRIRNYCDGATRSEIALAAV
jgi:radical SAM superfamily enzyme YgiQ (UPF0313 family)